MGIMYIIWNNKMWGSWDGTWADYNGCAKTPSTALDSACHRNHMHLSLSWPGAMARTSWWTGTVAGPDYGPCRARDLNWAAPYAKVRLTPCPRYPQVQAPATASATLRTLTRYSGMRLASGSTGPVVRAVQQALRVSTTGSYGAATKTAVRAFQTAHRLSAGGKVNSATWRALLASLAP
jgi:hypothetical protein